MAQFTDKTGRVWPVELTVPLISKINQSHGIQMTNLESDPLQKLRNDPMILVSVIHLICESKINELGLTPDQFAESLVFPPDPMLEAVAESIVNFYPTGRASYVRDAMAKHTEMGAKVDQIAMAKMAQIIADPKSTELIGRKADQEIAAAMESMFGKPTAPGTSSTTAPT